MYGYKPCDMTKKDIIYYNAYKAAFEKDTFSLPLYRRILEGAKIVFTPAHFLHGLTKYANLNIQTKWNSLKTNCFSVHFW